MRLWRKSSKTHVPTSLLNTNFEKYVLKHRLKIFSVACFRKIFTELLNADKIIIMTCYNRLPRSRWEYNKTQHSPNNKQFFVVLLNLVGSCLQKDTPPGIYPRNLNVRYSAQKVQSFNWVLKLNLHIYVSVCLFVLLLRYWSSFAVAFLAAKIKRYLHVSYMQMFDYLHIPGITHITY